MTKAKKEKDESYLDFLGVSEEKPGEEKKGEGEPTTTDQIAGLMKTIEGLSSTVDTLQQQVTLGAQAPAQAPVIPSEPKLKDISFDGLPDQETDPAGFATALNTRMSDTLRDNMRAMTEHNAAKTAAASAGETRTEQLWDDFQNQYMTKLEVDLPKGMEALPYVEVAAKAVAKRAGRRGLDLDRYMYQGSFMQDVFAEADKVLKPFRASGEGEGEGEGEKRPTAEEAEEATRTGGIFGTGGAGEPGGGEKPDKSTLISDLQEIQTKSGFF